MQVRSIECVDSHGVHNTQCEPATRPVTMQSCSTGISCSSEAPPTESADNPSSDNPNEADLDDGIDGVVDDVTEEEDDDDRKNSSAGAAKSRSNDADDEAEDDEDELDMQGDDPREQTRHVPLAYQYRIPRAERIVDPNAPNEPT